MIIFKEEKLGCYLIISRNVENLYFVENLLLFCTFLYSEMRVVEVFFSAIILMELRN